MYELPRTLEGGLRHRNTHATDEVKAYRCFSSSEMLQMLRFRLIVIDYVNCGFNAILTLLDNWYFKIRTLLVFCLADTVLSIKQ